MSYGLRYADVAAVMGVGWSSPSPLDLNSVDPPAGGQVPGRHIPIAIAGSPEVENGARLNRHIQKKKRGQRYSSGEPFAVSGAVLVYWQQTPRASSRSWAGRSEGGISMGIPQPSLSKTCFACSSCSSASLLSLG